MKRAILSVIIGSILLTVGIFMFTRFVAGASVTRDNPPQCFTVRIANPSGATFWYRFCGTGANGISPLEEGVSGNGPLQVDGAFLHPIGCGGKLDPCIIIWPKSPALP